MATVQFKDYYQSLGVPRDADDKAVRSAFRKLARQHHPDINPGDPAAEERFKEINEAFEVLSDAEKRKMYDRYGEDWQRYRDAGFTGDEPANRPGARPTDFGSWFAGQGNGNGDRGSYRVDLGNGDDGNFSDFFHTLFGAARSRAGRGPAAPSRPRRRRGEDLEVAVEVSFEEAFHGARRSFDIQTQETCPTCGGTGLIREAMCPTCDGSGVVPRRKTIEVRIPPGVATGSRVRVAGQGGRGIEGGANGDVYLRITVARDDRFEREGDDLRTEIDVPLYSALLGGEATVPTPTGQVLLTIPPETQPGRVFRLRKQGMPKLRSSDGERGDLLVRTRISLPTGLSDRERALVAELRDLRAGAR